jgi:hypothetical protein
MNRQSSLVALSIAIAKVTLMERARRRKLISGVLVALLGLFVLGNWPLSKWLGGSPWLMFLWLGGCTFLALFLALLALYDALSVGKEERSKLGIGKEDETEE